MHRLDPRLILPHTLACEYSIINQVLKHHDYLRLSAVALTSGPYRHHVQRTNLIAVLSGDPCRLRPNNTVSVLWRDSTTSANADTGVVFEVKRNRSREDTTDVPAGGPAEYLVGSTAQRWEYPEHHRADPRWSIRYGTSSTVASLLNR